MVTGFLWTSVLPGLWLLFGCLLASSLSCPPVVFEKEALYRVPVVTAHSLCIPGVGVLKQWGVLLGLEGRSLSKRGLEERVGGGGNRRCLAGHVGLCLISVKLHSEIGQHQRIRSTGSS